MKVNPGKGGYPGIQMILQMASCPINGITPVMGINKLFPVISRVCIGLKDACQQYGFETKFG